jgi:hypothetical protein
MQTRLVFNSRASCLSLLNIGITGRHHHAQPVFSLYIKQPQVFVIIMEMD